MNQTSHRAGIPEPFKRLPWARLTCNCPKTRYNCFMNWTDCPIIEVIPGKMSGAPVLRHSRVRPEDIIENEEEGEDWIADAYGLPIEDVRTVLSFYHRQASLARPA